MNSVGLKSSSGGVKTNLINFSKYRLLDKYVTDLLQYQTTSYKFRIHNEMRAFVLEDIENYFKTAQKALESQDDEQEMNRPDPSQMVESWLFACSKKIELKEAFNFPRKKNN